MLFLIAAIQKSDRGLGFQGDLLYKIPEDLKHFKATTTGYSVIMGRKTWESIPKKFRPLSGRYNIVVTRNPDYIAKGACVAGSLEHAIKIGKQHNNKIFVIGGAQLYAESLSNADCLYMTLIEGNKTADVFFPAYEKIFTKVIMKENLTTENGKKIEFITLKKHK